jgi:hypothetical protein
MGYNRDSLWRIYQIGGAELALRYAEIAEERSRTSSGPRESAKASKAAAVRQFKVLGLRFYSESLWLAASTERTFARQFPARPTWRICFEASIENPWHHTSMECDLRARCYGPSGQPLGDIRKRLEITPDYRIYPYTDGWMPQALGGWDEGVYRVEVSVDAAEPTTDTFKVVDDGPSMLLNNPLIRLGRRS